jgi:alpha-beta hydrolase superfamily lysophospholipase
MRLLISLSVLCFVAACMMPRGNELPAQRMDGTLLAAAGTAAIGPVPHEADWLTARDGTALPLRSWMPQGTPRAVVLAIHGFNDYSNGFADPAALMARHGIATFAYDQRGFGNAPGRGLWAGTDRMVDDALDAMALLRRRYPGVPLYVMGESMGGAVAVLAANRGGSGAADGFILLAPAVWGRSAMNLFERTGLWLADLFPAIEWSPRALPIVIRPSDNDAALRALAADPLVIKTARSDTLNGLVDLMDAALAAAPHFTANAFILYGEQDAIVPRAPVAHFVTTLPRDAAERQRIALYRAGYHLLLRDLEGPMVTEDLIAWITNSRAPLPSGADREARTRLAGRTPLTGAMRTIPAPDPAS